MENLKVVVSGTFKEKAMLLSVIGDALEANGIKVQYKEKAVDQLVRDHCGNVCANEVLSSNLTIDLELENLQNTNTVADLTALYHELGLTPIKETSEGYVKAIREVINKIGKILLI